MSKSTEAGKIVTHQEITTESEDEDSDSSTDFDPEEIEKEIMGVKSMLRRHCGRHKVRRRNEHFHSRGLQLCKLIGTKWRKFFCLFWDRLFARISGFLLCDWSLIGPWPLYGSSLYIITSFVRQLFLFIPLFLFTGRKPHNRHSRFFVSFGALCSTSVTFISGKGHCPAGAPNVNFWKITARKTIWDLEFWKHLSVKFLACLPLLGFSNI